MIPVYRIRNFLDYFETSDSRKRTGPMEWVKMRTKHDGRGYRRVTRLRNASATLCGWYLLLQVAAKMPARGLLADLDGPLDAQDLADKTGIPSSTFKAAIEALQKDNIGWIEVLEWDSEVGFEGNLARLGICRSGTGNDRQATADTGRRKEKEKTAGSYGAPALSSTNRQMAADDGRSEDVAATNGSEKKREHNKTFPFSLPQGEEGDGQIGFEAAKQLLNELFGRKKRAWSFEENELLSQAIPISREDWSLIAAWFRLPLDHPVFEVTKRKQELTTFLRDFNGEIDKIRRHSSLFAPRIAPAEKKSPEKWREFFLNKYGEDCVLPPRFDQLPVDQRREYERESEVFLAALKKENGPPHWREFLVWKFGPEVSLPSSFSFLSPPHRAAWEAEHASFEDRQHQEDQRGAAAA